VFQHAHRSLLEALCGYYTVAFVLLRTTLELLLKGAFWECLSHKEFRDNSPILDASAPGREIKSWLQAIFKEAPHIEGEFEQISAGIFDKVGFRIEESTFRPSIKTLVQQLDRWGIFNPIDDPVSILYERMYKRLSADVHVVPDRTDIGRRLVAEQDLFEQNVIPDLIREYATTLHEIMDIAIVIELNVMRDLIERLRPVRLKLAERLVVLEQLGLRYSFMRMQELLKL
jgi:hypothetical protein